MPFVSDIYFNDFIFKFFLFVYRGSVYFHSRNCAGFKLNFAFSSAVKMSLKAGASFAFIKTEITPNDFAKWLNCLYPKNQHIHNKYNAKHKKKVIRLNRMFFKIFSFIFYATAIKPVLTFEYFGFVFSKLKLNYNYVHVRSWKTTFSVLIG